MSFGKAVLTGAFACVSLVSVSTFAAPAPQADEHAVRHAAVCPGPASHGNARCHAHVVVDSAGNPMATTGPSGFSPAKLRDAYKVTGSGSSTTIIAIVDAYGYPSAEADLAKYRAQFGLLPCTTSNGCFKKVDQRGGAAYPRTDTGWSQESALDLDMASAMCPNCSLILVEADTPSFGNLAAAVDMAVALGASVVSNSYGGGENGSLAYDSHYNHPGIAITVSSGDNGYGVEYPAASPTVIAVGGTSLKAATNARGYTETAWSGAGSGCSTIYAKPTWQNDAGCSNRSVADVSAVADPSTGVAVYAPTNRKGSAWLVFGGTSVAAPLIGGIYGVAGGHPASSASGLYAAGASLFDVTSGTNGNCGGTYLCTAGAGYDGPTGLGTPNGVTAFAQ